MTETGPVWVFIEQLEGVLSPGSLELLGKGRELADAAGAPLEAVLIGSGVAEKARELFHLGVQRVYLADQEGLGLYQSGPYVQVLSRLVWRHSPDIVLFYASSVGTDLAGRCAGRLETGLTAHCIDLFIDPASGNLIQAVPGFGGNVIYKNVCADRRPQMATVRGGISKRPEPDTSLEGEAVRETFEFKPEDLRARTKAFIPETVESLPLDTAEVVVGFGYGVRTPEDLQLIRDLAAALGPDTAIGGTRPVVDEGMITEAEMIGQSGKFIAPKLYFAIGISGALHHNVGVADAGFIVAVNRDPNAPIFEIADLGIVGDLREVVPKLIEEIKARG